VLSAVGIDSRTPKAWKPVSADHRNAMRLTLLALDWPTMNWPSPLIALAVLKGEALGNHPSGVNDGWAVLEPAHINRPATWPMSFMNRSW
jgi:hypothetical protein